MTRAAAADSGAELKRGALTNTVALLASNFRGIFTFLVARLLGPAALGTFSVAWAMTDLLTKIGIFGLDNTATTFIARAEAAGHRAQSRRIFRVSVILAVAQSALLAGGAILLLQLCRRAFSLDPRMTSALSLLLCASPGLACYRMNTAVSRGFKVMRHDIYSRGLTETVVTTLAFLLAVNFGWRHVAPEIGAIVGTSASGFVALVLAHSLFRGEVVRGLTSSFGHDARRLLAFAAPITAYDLLNAFIVRIDVLVLGCFIGRAPGVTLSVVGVYGAVVEVAGGLRKINQIFNPIFVPVVAAMTREGKQEEAVAAFMRVAEWMLWALFPLLGVMVLAGPTILGIYGDAFRAGSYWLIIVAIACAANAFVGLAETVIMVQQPRLNLRNSAITCAIALAANIVLIAKFGVTGAAFGILLPYLLLGFLRYRTLRLRLGWNENWSRLRAPLRAALLAGIPAVLVRLFNPNTTGQILATAFFACLYLTAWRLHRSRKIDQLPE